MSSSPKQQTQTTPSTPAPEAGRKAVPVERRFSRPGQSPFDGLAWEKRHARIGAEGGKTIFEQEDVEVPSSWTQLATNVVVSKYFYGEPGTPQRETSVRQLIHRVCRTIADWGRQDGIFATDADADCFYDELATLCVKQYGAFNSPVWFNVGLRQQYGIDGSEGNFHWDATAEQPARTLRSYEYPQASACFIQSVGDSMEEIMALASAEAMLFKYGSGTGSDLSTLRSSREKLNGGGTPSGPVSFMRVFDQVAAVIKSGGKTRRAAKMQSLRCDHPDIEEFIECKPAEERKAWALIEQGYDGSFNGEAYSSVMFQNANLSVRATDAFMQAAVDEKDWTTRAVTTGEPVETLKARKLLKGIAEGTHICGDPGMQFHTTINTWHTCPESGEINASNPCSEYMFLNDSACNLASLNLMKFRQADGSFDTESFSAAARLFIIAQEILVDHASYPSAEICRNSHDYRPLGLGYANLGALLMSLGLPYDSDGGRATAAAITSVMCGSAYSASAELAGCVGPFAGYGPNAEAMQKVIGMHREAVGEIAAGDCPADLLAAARSAWDAAYAAGQANGYRNAQVCVLAPTGTIGFMMDCDTTGIEPDIALVKYKQLAGGGMFKLVNNTVPLALERLGYSTTQVAEIIEHIDSNDTIEGAAALDDKHLPVFDCAFKPANGNRSIHYMGHIRMMAAVQPFLSGAISKTVNVPKEATVQEIMDLYIDAWKLGLKAVAVYRDGSKRIQPLSVNKTASAEATSEELVHISPEQLEQARRTPHRRRLPATRPSVTHKFDVANHEGYLTVGLYEDGGPGEVFISMAKEGSTVGGMMDAFATAVSLCLQYGVPLEALVKKFSHQRFDPSGMTGNRDIPFAKSIVDYIFRWMGLAFLESYRKEHLKTDRKGAGSSLPPIQAAPEAVKDDANSEPTGADTGAGKEFANPVGAELRRSGPAVAAGPKRAIQLDEKAASPARRSTLFGIQGQEDAPPCSNCGEIMVRNGSCYKCANCGSTSGCS